MSEIDHAGHDEHTSAIFNGIGNFFDQNKKPLFAEYRTANTDIGFHIVFGGIRILYGN